MSGRVAAVFRASPSLACRINVTGLYVGYMDTDMAAHVDSPKSEPRAMVQQALDGVAADASEVIADDLTRLVKSHLSADPAELYQRIGR